VYALIVKKNRDNKKSYLAFFYIMKQVCTIELVVD